MRKVDWFWNIIHYFVYRGVCKLDIFSNKFNPTLLIYKLPFNKKHFARAHVAPIDNSDKAWKRFDTGIATFWSGVFMGLLLLSLFSGFFNFIIGFLKLEPYFKIFHVAFTIVLSVVINEVLIFRKNRYIKYFNEFEIMNKVERKKWKSKCAIFILSSLIFCILGLVFLLKRITLMPLS